MPISGKELPSDYGDDVLSAILAALCLSSQPRKKRFFTLCRKPRATHKKSASRASERANIFSR
jgi:hypothetical protein